MRIEPSPLVLKDFVIFESSYRFKSLNKKEKSQELFQQYPVDFDFVAQEKEDGEIYIMVRADINKTDDPLSGYLLSAKGAAIFEFKNKADLSQKDVSNLVYFSGLGIAINNLRSYIINMTMYGPLGKYVLPSIDLNALHKERKKAKKEE